MHREVSKKMTFECLQSSETRLETCYLHPFSAKKSLDGPRNDVKFAWKVQRDVAERGWTEEQALPSVSLRRYYTRA